MRRPSHMEDHIFQQIVERGDHFPVTPDMIRFSLPSIEDFREVVPDTMSSDELDWVYLRHSTHGRETSPEWRARLMYYINHFVKMRTDPDFIKSEAVVCHLSNNNLQKSRWKVIRDMELKANPDGDVTDFVEWYTEMAGRFYRNGHDGRHVLTKEGDRWFPTHFDDGLRFPGRHTAYLHARQQASKRFLSIVERVL